MPAHSRAFVLAALAPLAALPALARAEDPFSAHVRPTEPLAPEEQAETFRLPPGFEIQLVAAEPDIQKPLNLAFDARGRLWVTGTVEYPYAAPEGREGRDTVKILEDADGDGRAERITTFAGGLNIPIGVYPCRGGAVVFSIPNIYFLEDTDGDDRADRRTVLYGPFGLREDRPRRVDGAPPHLPRGGEARSADLHAAVEHRRLVWQDLPAYRRKGLAPVLP